MESRLRTADNLVNIGHYGFVANPDLKPAGGLRGFFDSAASGIWDLLTERLKLVNEDRLRKTLVMAGMYNTSPRMLIGYQLLGAVALPTFWIWIAVATGTSTALTVIAAIFWAALGWFGP